MQTGGDVVRRRLLPWAVAACVAALGVVGAATLLTLGGIAACAAPPHGWHPIPPPASTIVAVIGPPLVVFLVGEFFALGPKRRSLRVVLSSFVLIATTVALAYSSQALPYCGTWGP